LPLDQTEEDKVAEMVAIEKRDVPRIVPLCCEALPVGGSEQTKSFPRSTSHCSESSQIKDVEQERYVPKNIPWCYEAIPVHEAKMEGCDLKLDPCIQTGSLLKNINPEHYPASTDSNLDAVSKLEDKDKNYVSAKQGERSGLLWPKWSFQHKNGKDCTIPSNPGECEDNKECSTSDHFPMKKQGRIKENIEGILEGTDHLVQRTGFKQNLNCCFGAPCMTYDDQQKENIKKAQNGKNVAMWSTRKTLKDKLVGHEKRCDIIDQQIEGNNPLERQAVDASRKGKSVGSPPSERHQVEAVVKENLGEKIKAFGHHNEVQGKILLETDEKVLAETNYLLVHEQRLGRNEETGIKVAEKGANDSVERESAHKVLTDKNQFMLTNKDKDYIQWTCDQPIGECNRENGLDKSEESMSHVEEDEIRRALDHIGLHETETTELSVRKDLSLSKVLNIPNVEKLFSEESDLVDCRGKIKNVSPVYHSANKNLPCKSDCLLIAENLFPQASELLGNALEEPFHNEKPDIPISKMSGLDKREYSKKENDVGKDILASKELDDTSDIPSNSQESLSKTNHSPEIVHETYSLHGRRGGEENETTGEETRLLGHQFEDPAEEELRASKVNGIPREEHIGIHAKDYETARLDHETQIAENRFPEKEQRIPTNEPFTPGKELGLKYQMFGFSEEGEEKLAITPEKPSKLKNEHKAQFLFELHNQCNSKLEDEKGTDAGPGDDKQAINRENSDDKTRQHLLDEGIQDQILYRKSQKFRVLIMRYVYLPLT
jgi:hypothetical protein